MSFYGQTAAQKLKEVQKRPGVSSKPKTPAAAPAKSEAITETAADCARFKSSLAASTNTVPHSDDTRKESKTCQPMRLTPELVMSQQSEEVTTGGISKTQPLPHGMVMVAYRNESMTVDTFMKRAFQSRPHDYALEASARMYDRSAVLCRTKSSEALLSTGEDAKDNGEYKRCLEAWAQERKQGVDGHTTTATSRRTRRTKVDETLMLRALMRMLFGEPTKEESRARELMDMIVLTHRRFTNSETLVRELLDVYHNPLKMCGLALVKDEDKTRWERENREWSLRCLLLWAKCVSEFDTDIGALDVFSSFLCNEALAQHVVFATECCRCLLSDFIPMFTDNTKTSATLSCTKAFCDTNALVSSLSAPLEWTLATEDLFRPRRERHRLCDNHSSFTHGLNLTVLTAICAPPTAVDTSTLSPTASSGSGAPSTPHPIRGSSPIISQRSFVLNSSRERPKRLTPPSPRQMSASQASLKSDSVPTSPRKVSQVDYQFMSSSQLTEATKLSRHRIDSSTGTISSSGTAKAKDRQNTIRSTLMHLDKQESQVTEKHLALFWRSCVFSRTTDHAKVRCFHEFVAKDGVAAAAHEFNMKSEEIVALAQQLVNSGELCAVPPSTTTTFSNNSERFYFADDAPSFPLVFQPSDFHSEFFPPFCVEGTLPENIPLLDVPPLELARQLTLHEHDMFRKWRLAELEASRWDEKDEAVRRGSAPNIVALVEHTDRLTKWVPCTIVMMGADLKQRVKALKFFVELADACRVLHNFNAMHAIVIGLQHGAVERLEATHKALDSSVQQRLSALKEIRTYRALSIAAEPPLVPDVATFLNGIKIGQETAFMDAKIIMDRLRELTKCYRIVLDAKHRLYTFKRHPRLQTLFQSGFVVDHYDNLMAFSKKYEPPADVDASK